MAVGPLGAVLHFGRQRGSTQMALLEMRLANGCVLRTCFCSRRCTAVWGRTAISHRLKQEYGAIVIVRVRDNSVKRLAR